MTLAQLEVWVLDIIDRVTQGRPVEDSRVELKAAWPIDTSRAARRLAGHANAARGSQILWIIGLDETKGVIGVEAAETGDWIRRVAAQFDGLSPTSVDLIVPTIHGHLVALLFDTSRAPFLVSVPAFGKVAGVSASLEVPWREGTDVRTARRDDLLRILVSQVEQPTIEVLEATLERLQPAKAGDANIWVSVRLYVVPSGVERIVYPLHRASLTLQANANGVWSACEYLGFDVPPPPSYDTRTAYGSHTIRGTHTEVLVDGPGTFAVAGRARFQFSEEERVTFFDIACTLRGAPEGASVSLMLRVQKEPRDALDVSKWSLGK